MGRKPATGPMDSAYRPLGDYLTRQPGPACVLAFCEIEAHLGRPLPLTASARRPWWSNHHGHSRAHHGWLTAGWRIASVALARQGVTFRKG